MEIGEAFERIWENLVARPSGPLALRFFLQPLVAASLAIRDGLRDARDARPPYLRTLIGEPGQRRALLLEGLRAVGTVLTLALLLDVIYQLVSRGRVYPGEALLVALVLGFVPYLVLRGPACRLARGWRRPPGQLRPVDGAGTP